MQACNRDSEYIILTSVLSITNFVCEMLSNRLINTHTCRRTTIKHTEIYKILHEHIGTSSVRTIELLCSRIIYWEITTRTPCVWLCLQTEMSVILGFAGNRIMLFLLAKLGELKENIYMILIIGQSESAYLIWNLKNLCDWTECSFYSLLC